MSVADEALVYARPVVLAQEVRVQVAVRCWTHNDV